jgi:hypothetical protein
MNKPLKISRKMKRVLEFVQHYDAVVEVIETPTDLNISIFEPISDTSNAGHVFCETCSGRTLQKLEQAGFIVPIERYEQILDEETLVWNQGTPYNKTLYKWTGQTLIKVSNAVRD